MLARWLLDAGFLAFLQPVVPRFMVPWVSFGMLGVSTLASWRTLGRSWDDLGTLEVTRKDPVRSRLGFYRCFVDFGGHSESFLGIFGSKKKFFSIYFQVAFSVSFWV